MAPRTFYLSLVAFIFSVLAQGADPCWLLGSGGSILRPFVGRALPVTSGLCASSVTAHGYKCQEHQVTTEDGYVLSMQRIPEGRVGGNGSGKKQPVLIQHGIFVDGMTWLMNSPDQNLPMMLAHKGYDVWIANTRGTRYSRNHTSLNADTDQEYWSWSWDELAAYELPALFDFISNQTGQMVHYVGHSMGTLIVLASLSEGRLVDKIKSVALLSPVAYLSHMKNPMVHVAATAFLDEILNGAFGDCEFNPSGQRVSKFVRALCTAAPWISCADLVTLITGKNCCLNSSIVGLFLKNEPQSTSTRNLVHFAQIIRNGMVAKFNFGRVDKNLEHYGEAEPPAYDMSKISRRVPLFLAYGGQDAISNVSDVLRLVDDLKLRDKDKLTVHFIKDYGHGDFIMGVNAKDKVYNQVISFFERHHQ